VRFWSRRHPAHRFWVDPTTVHRRRPCRRSGSADNDGNIVDPVDLVDYNTSGTPSGFAADLPTTASGNNLPIVDYGGYENGGLITDSGDGGNVVMAGYEPSSATVIGTAPGTAHDSWSVKSASDVVIPCKAGNAVTVSGSVAPTCKVVSGNVLASDGPYTVTAAFSGNTDNAASTGTYDEAVATAASAVKLKVTPPASSGSPGSLKAVVTGVANTAVPASSGVPTGTVTFTITDSSDNPVSCDGGDTVAVNATGRAICTISSSLVSGGSPYTATATYNGDDTFSPSTAPTKSIVVPG
jgi:hypothetical protein